MRRKGRRKEGKKREEKRGVGKDLVRKKSYGKRIEHTRRKGIEEKNMKRLIKTDEKK